MTDEEADLVCLRAVRRCRPEQNRAGRIVIEPVDFLPAADDGGWELYQDWDGILLARPRITADLTFVSGEAQNAMQMPQAVDLCSLRDEEGS